VTPAPKTGVSLALLALRDRTAAHAARLFQIEFGLKLQPETLLGTQRRRQARIGIYGDVAPAEHDVVDMDWRQEKKGTRKRGREKGDVAN